MSQRAYTNPLSNTVVLSRFNLGEGLDTAAHMQLPKRCVPQFLHEVMHHWCFNSPVGLALALLQIRAHRTAVSRLLSDSVDDRTRFAIAQDLSRVHCFLEFTRPVLEGLALFAEHDLTIGQSEIVSTPAMLTGLMFAGRQNEPDAYLKLAPLIISSARLTPAHIRRKANLFLQPFGGTPDGYLAGYLYIRLMYRIAVERCKAFVDADFFSHAFRNWVFDDWALVDLLLTDTDYEKWIEEMILYCQKRMAGFIQITSDDLAQFERRSVTGDADLFRYNGPRLDMTFYCQPVLQVDTQGKEKLTILLDELFREEPDSPPLKSSFATDLDLLALRTTLTLGHGEFDAKVTSGGMMVLSIEEVPHPVFATGTPEGLSAGWNDKVLVSLVLALSPPGLYQFIGTKDRMIRSESFGSDREVPDYLRTPLVDWKKRHAKMDLEDAAATAVLKDSVEESILELTLERVRTTRNAVFELKGLSLTPDELIETAQRILLSDGFLPVLDDSPDLVLDAAAASVCASLRVDATTALPNWKWSHDNAFATADHVNACFLKALGFKPFLIDRGNVLFSMI